MHAHGFVNAGEVCTTVLFYLHSTYTCMRAVCTLFILIISYKSSIYLYPPFLGIFSNLRTLLHSYTLNLFCTKYLSNYGTI